MQGIFQFKDLIKNMFNYILTLVYLEYFG